MMTGLSDEKIVSLLGVHTLWTKKACREILRRRDDFIPLLLDILDKTIEDPLWDGAYEKCMHISAAMLLAQMREPAAYAKLIELISFDVDKTDMLWGDFLPEYFDKILRDTFNGDSSLIPQMMENRSVSPWSRSMALQAWGMHYFDGRIGREEVTGQLRHFIHEVYTGKLNQDDDIILSYIADIIRKQGLEELIPDVKSLYDRGSIDIMLCGEYEEYTSAFHEPIYLAQDEHLDDVIQEMQRWNWFDETKWTNDEEYEDDRISTMPSGKIGRNEPCPCGSGKKYKNCCLGEV